MSLSSEYPTGYIAFIEIFFRPLLCRAHTHQLNLQVMDTVSFRCYHFPTPLLVVAEIDSMVVWLPVYQPIAVSHG